MIRFTQACPWLTLAALGIGLIAYAFVEPIQPPLTPLPVPTIAERFEPKIKRANYLGATSCAAASCHGNDGHGTRSEYLTWAGQDPETDSARDPHSRAYRVLFNEVSDRIIRNMAASGTGVEVAAHENGLCLKCHAQTAFATRVFPAEKVAADRIVDRNVGCESCHGPAEHYLSQHYLPDFLAKNAHEKARDYGLYPTKDLAFRVQLCASCHMGDGSREVNHDLIAAGHPRLNFEYTSFHHHPKYEKHWKEKSSDFETRAWAIGQAAVLRNSVELLKARAEASIKAEAAVPWPEFAEYSCFACHQDLNPSRSSWKLVNPSPHAPGAMPWGAWTMPTLEVLEGYTVRPGASPRADLESIRGLMEAPSPDRKKIAELCGTTIDKLDRWLKEIQAATPPASADLFGALAASATKSSDWDSAMQHYLALEALTRDRPSANPAIAGKLNEIRKALRFEKDLNSPRNVDPKEVIKKFTELHDLSRSK